MLKQLMIFFAFIGFALIVCVQTESLPLLFYVLFPALLFPVFFFYDNRRRGWLFYSAVGVSGLVYLFYSFRIFRLEIVLFAIVLVGFFLFFAYQRKVRQKALEETLRKKAASLKELKDLKKKHETRLESLHHLEKQVSGLLDLFEIARDFSESLSMDSISDLLYQKVRPELPFEKMKIIQQEQNETGEETKVLSMITCEGVEKTDTELTPDDVENLKKTKAQRQMIKTDKQWVFPLLSEGATSSCIVVEGSSEDDIAKFEVLAAYLALQVKKVKLYETVRELSIRDELTGVFVRRHFLERFEEELRRSVKHELPLSVLMLDIDHFKRYNDEYGHLAGDAVLKQVTYLLKESLRKVDVVARYGGEEFVIILPETQETGAFEVAERIRSSVARNHFKIFNEETRVTVSLGVGIFPVDVADRLPVTDYQDVAFDLIQRADKAMYRAKEEGRNRVVLYKSL